MSLSFAQNWNFSFKKQRCWDESFLESLSQNTKTSFIFYHLGSCSIDWRSVFIFTLNLGLPWKINYTRLSAQSKEESIDILFNFLLLQEQDVDWLNSVWLLNLVDLNNKVITYGEFQMHWLVILIMQCLGTTLTCIIVSLWFLCVDDG